MDLIDMYFDQIEDAKQRRVPFIIPVGTIEYHAHHVSSGTDTMVVTGCLRELGKEKEIVVLPPIWYGVASYAVGGPETGTIHVDEDTHTQYVYCILKSLVWGGVKNIYLIPHHQTEAGALMPMTISCHKAAKKVTMEYMEATKGVGWWGSNDYQDYYENLGSGDDPFSYIKVIPLISKEAQIACGGFDHAGKWETSLMMGTYPDHVDLTRCKLNTEWFAQSAVEATAEIGRHMVNSVLDWLREAIV
ncbi:MAG TPA: creatininase family protein [Sphaerochaeta sp.]|mgnify:FL=1|jgi:creatinine amidohydrolase/Fe(II)-dependent formamide hydrolase-like protein|nr:creatininase family protein [Sphaerochaeta sp.]HPY45848.1 creatininase family protein [Sphaerochaeta sp.]HQB05122.1 creatininase family protein [Sphaerochaeta sp.]